MNVVFAEFPETRNRDVQTEITYLPKDCTISYAVYEESGMEQFYADLSHADAVITGFVPIGKEAIDRMKHCKIISVEATGYNFIDVEYAKEKGIAVSCVAEYCTCEVADHTITLMLSLLRGIPFLRRGIEERYAWEVESIQNLGIHRLAGQILGIVGFGKIGRAVAKRAQSFGITVVAYDPFISKEVGKESNVKLIGLDELLQISDVITIHMNLTKENTGLFDRKMFLKMKKCPLILNVSRGGAVVEADLLEALDENVIRGAGLDVLESEMPNLKTNPLLHRDNVLLTPHTAFYSDESIEESERITALNVTYYLNGELEKIYRLL